MWRTLSKNSVDMTSRPAENDLKTKLNAEKTPESTTSFEHEKRLRSQVKTTSGYHIVLVIVCGGCCQRIVLICQAELLKMTLTQNLTLKKHQNRLSFEHEIKVKTTVG